MLLNIMIIGLVEVAMLLNIMIIELVEVAMLLNIMIIGLIIEVAMLLNISRYDTFSRMILYCQTSHCLPGMLPVVA